ncbi:TPA: DUF1120 domain-containing protein [Kluyvera ascorbata]|nr:DUF1120 domain-containing protein [Kluyvera ascorbata]
MKKLLVATTVAMTLSAAAHAADGTAVLKLTGTLSNQPCTPTLSGGGTVDFGTKHLDELSATATNQLGSKDLTLSIACTAPTKMGWTIADDRADTRAKVTIEGGWTQDDVVFSSSTSMQFGAGKTAGGVNIGAYSVSLSNTASIADGVAKPITMGTGSDATTDWTAFSVGYDFVKGTNDITYTVSDDGTAPIAFTDAVFPLRISLAVEKTDTLAITEETPIDGQATITMVYL